MHFNYFPISLLSFNGTAFNRSNAFKSNTPTNILSYVYIYGYASPATLMVSLPICLQGRDKNLTVKACYVAVVIAKPIKSV